VYTIELSHPTDPRWLLVDELPDRVTVDDLASCGFRLQAVRRAGRRLGPSGLSYPRPFQFESFDGGRQQGFPASGRRNTARVQHRASSLGSSRLLMRRQITELSDNGEPCLFGA
jgi:hypothetical protein